LEGSFIADKIPKDYSPEVTLFRDTNVLFSDVNSINKQDHHGSEYINLKLDEELENRVLESFGESRESMSHLLKNDSYKIDYQKFSESTLDKVVADVYDKIAKTNDLGDKKAEIEKRVSQTPSIKIKNLLHLEEPIMNIPLFAEDIRRGKVQEYAEIASLDNKVTKFEEMKLDFGSINKMGLSSLVDKKIINQKQEKELDTVINLGRLTFDNYDLVRHLKKENKISSRDLVGITASDWSEIISKEKFPVPKGETGKSYGELISYNIEMAYPSQSILNRILEQENIKKVSNLDSLNPLLENNEKLLVDKRPAADIDWKQTSKDRTRLQKELIEMNHLANTFSAMGVPQIINDRSLSLSEKKIAINQNINALDKFYENNPDVDLMQVNFFDTKADLDWIGIKHKEPVKKELMAIQRTLYLEPYASDTITLMENGFDSAFSVSKISLLEFTEKSGLNAYKSALVHQNAKEETEQTAHTHQAIQDILSGDFGTINVSNINPSVTNDLKNIDGFDKFFESQNYCSCTECQSIFSPAAYFVDLMYFIEQYISNQAFVSNPNHHLHLKTRRPDLWNLELTCENTDEIVPYLTIVNEVLEKYLTEKLIWQIQRKTNTRLTRKQNLASRTEVSIYKKLAKPPEKNSFALPFSLPLEELRLYLGYFEMPLYEIYKLLREPSQKVWRARLNLSKEEFEVITSPDISEIKFRFGNPDKTKSMSLQEFIRIVGINRTQLEDLSSLSYNQDLQEIKVHKKPMPNDPQNFEEILQNLTCSRLDFIHRFIRLWKKTPWSIPELDLVLTCLYQKNIINKSLGRQSVTSIAHLVDIQERVDLSVEELVSMFASMPVSEAFPKSPEKDEDKKLFERLFDVEKIFGKNPKTNEINTSTTFHHYHFNVVNQDDVEVDPINSHLLGGLGISEIELIFLFDLLKTEIPFDKNGNCTLDIEKISLLYRHARLSKALSFSVDEFIQSLVLIFDSANLTIKSPEQIHKITEFTEWQKDSPFTVYELRFVLTGNEFESTKYQTNIESVHLMIQEIKNSQKDKRSSLKEYLMQTYNLSKIQLDNILKWVNMDIESFLKALSADKKSEDIDKLAEHLLDLTKEIEQVQLVINNLDISEENLSHISSKPKVLGISDLKNLTLGDIKSLVILMDMLPESHSGPF